MSRIARITLVTAICAVMPEVHAATGVEDVPFVQEYHESYPIEPGGPGDDVRAIVVDKLGSVWAATKAGLHVLRNGKWAAVTGVTAWSLRM